MAKNIKADQAVAHADPKSTFDTNVGATVSILEAARHSTSMRAVVIVTSDKFYENREWPWGYRENDPMGGSDPYSASKGATELACSAYWRSFFKSNRNRSIGLATARAGNVIGGGDWAKDRIIWPGGLTAVGRTRKDSPNEATSLRFSIGKTTKHLKWFPVVDISPAIEWTIDWYIGWSRTDGGMRQVSERQIQDYMALAAGGMSSQVPLTAVAT